MTIRGYLCLFIMLATPANAQIAPSASDVAGYDRLLLAAHEGDADTVRLEIAGGADTEKADRHGRTAVHIAAHASHEPIISLLAAAGANINALENDAYDAVTIAAVSVVTKRGTGRIRHHRGHILVFSIEVVKPFIQAIENPIAHGLRKPGSNRMLRRVRSSL